MCAYRCPEDCGNGDVVQAPEFCNRGLCEVQCLPACGGCAVNEECDEDACACVCAENVTCAPGFAWDDESCTCGCDTSVSCGPTRVRNLETCACECGENDQGVVDCNGACTGARPICQQSLCECREIDG